jgi:hypothetical protein
MKRVAVFCLVVPLVVLAVAGGVVIASVGFILDEI